MKSIIYNALVNKQIGIQYRYHQCHDDAKAVKKVFSWIYLLLINFGFYVLFMRFLGRLPKSEIERRKVCECLQELEKSSKVERNKLSSKNVELQKHNEQAENKIKELDNMKKSLESEKEQLIKKYKELEKVYIKEKNRIVINRKVSKLMSEFLYKLMYAYKYGGNLFEYFEDCGIDEFDLYVQDDAIGFIPDFMSLAKKMPDKIYGNIPSELNILGKKYKVDLIRNAKIQENTRVLVFCGMWNWSFFTRIEGINYKIVSFVDLVNYTLYKSVVFKQLKAIGEERQAKMLFTSIPKANDISNKSELEQYYANNSLYSYVKANSELYKSMGLDTDCIYTDTMGKIHSVNGIYKFVDEQSEHFNVVNGFRVTSDVPSDTKHTIWMFGPSVVRGALADDEHTIESAMQRICNEYFDNNSDYGIVNASNYSANDIWYVVDFMNNLPIQKGDICIFHMEYPKVLCEKNDEIIELGTYFERPHDFGEIFCDINHMNANGYQAQAKILFDLLLEKDYFNENYEFNNKPASQVNNASRYIDSEESVELQQYIDEIKKNKPRVGSIVMNCNPFTLGHRYLIETSAKKVDKLIIFVVQEDDKYFKFADRIELVRKGTADLPNVVVIPSGKFIASLKTFAAYSNKAEIQDQIIDPSMDIEIFGQYIVPALGIDIRFAGEEPLDKITKQYNDTMRRILPQYGVEFEVIKRREIAGAVVSASRVRKCLEDKNFEEIKKIVPKTTYDFLVENYS